VSHPSKSISSYIEARKPLWRSANHLFSDDTVKVAKKRMENLGDE
jgi:hypothetical protein